MPSTDVVSGLAGSAGRIEIERKKGYVYKTKSRGSQQKQRAPIPGMVDDEW